MSLLYECSTFFACVAILILGLSTSARADTFYVQSGPNVERVDNQDPETVLAQYWVVRFYQTGANNNGADFWGSEFGDSAADVMAQVERDQKIQKWGERDCACSWDPFGYFNILGPIAIVEETEAAKRNESRRETLLGQAERLQDLTEEYERIEEIIDEQPKEKNPFAGVGNSLKEYTDNLKSAIQLQTRLKGSLTNFEQQQTIMFDQSLNELSSYEDLCEKAIPGLKEVIDAFGPTPEPTPTPGSVSPGFNIEDSIMRGVHAICIPGPCPR